MNVTKANADNLTQYGSSPVIHFADAEVKRICVQNWDTDGDKELSQEEAVAVQDLGRDFCFNTQITSFDELSYFTGLSSIGNYDFMGCSNLTSIYIPASVTTISKGAFQYCI